ncbi:MAG: hypothetical protein JXO22_07900 [Phycisphaerae bacterium]|nr:hypothetical protein [Phycisphaerae bacterium]
MRVRVRGGGDVEVLAMMRVVFLTVVGVALAAVVHAEPYWIAYEGSDYPENEGWEHTAWGPLADRWLDEGCLFVDTRGQSGIVDTYANHPESGYELAAGETFVMCWSLVTLETTPWAAPGVAVTTDDGYALTFVFAENYVESTYEPGLQAEFEPGVFHHFEMRSSDMRHYEFSIDGALALEGEFGESFFDSGVGFGDLTSCYSLAQWDYFRFGVVPEPSNTQLMLLALAMLSRVRRT